ncbi:RHS repeat-associated core domain-containing protein [Sporosarcina limicola]|uniref:RHS repeat-associated protein n=1 Tax=Sporosarcina limicola TaxID=34101 RepID=A0A927MR19_9BACL|nr:RHS repeat-associated core domain-containing protein [Sporosarcina limicola]MBE1555924.1 RHS repeat-associated protein [Sporosarcina limicola]
MQYNELGQEIERILPGDVISKWQYDITGRPTNHRISSQNRHTRRRVYNWDVNHRLKGMVNELTAGQVTYGYDEFSNLVWANQDSQFDYLHRNVDDVGNLCETKEKTDRVYGAGSRLLETKEATFSYDEEGNLVQKAEKNGDTWKYEYNGNGMMSKVIKPDQTEVIFKYDPMGRRIEKSSNEKVMNFVWDGNTILHEYFSQHDSATLENLVEHSSQSKSETPANLVTWVFNDGFVPSAKITDEGNYSIISDYLGTPVEAYDEEGKKVWSAELDVYGRVKEFTGEKVFIPYRYQGQYEDVETGLYYNRFRYYDPEQGNYTQQDPIGLAGGNPTLYGYVYNPMIEIDPFGLAFGKSKPVDGWNYGNMPKPDGYQLHHIIPKSLFNGANPHDIFKLSGYDVNNIRNLIYLPTSRDNHPTRSVHRGFTSFHYKYNEDIRAELTVLVDKGKEEKWTSQQYRGAMQDLINEQRQELRKGRTKVHCEG